MRGKRSTSTAVAAYVCREPVDMRKSIDGLAQLAGPLLGADAFSGAVLVFVSRDRAKVKLLVWDRHGYWVAYKRLERGRFPKPETLCARALRVGELPSYSDATISCSWDRSVAGAPPRLPTR